MRKVISSTALALAALLLITEIALAAFTSLIQVVNTSSTTYDMLSANVTTNIKYMADNGYFAGTSGLDTRVILGTAERPYMLADDRLMFALPVPADSSQTLSFSTGSSNITNFRTIVGRGGSLGIADATNLEPSANFSINMRGYIDTTSGADKFLFQKGLFEAKVSPTVSGNITVATNDGSSIAGLLTGGDNIIGINGVNWNAQTFTTTDSVDIMRIRLKLYRVGSPGALTVSIRETSAGLPSGSDLSTTTFDADTLSAISPGAFIDTVVPVLTLSASTTYAVVVRALDGDGSNQALWRVDQTSPVYAGGARIYSSDNASSWTSVASQDTLFEVIDTNGITITATDVSVGDGTVVVSKGSADTQISLESGADDTTTMRGSSWRGQTFTTTDSFVLGAIAISGKKSGSPGDMNVSIMETSGGLPIGSDLTTGTIPEGILPTVSNFISANLTPYLLAASTQYAIVWAVPSGGGGNKFAIDLDISSPPLTGGARLISSDSGSSWSSVDSQDTLFKVISHSGIEILINGVFADGSGNSTPEILDTSEDWLLMQNNVMAYADNITIDTGGTLQLQYLPITILADINGSSATLPDRVGSDNPGTINWGSNPAGVAVSIANLISDFSVSSVSITGTQDIVPDIETPANVADATRLSNLQSSDPILYPIFNAVNEITGIAILAQYWMVFMAFALIAFAVTYSFIPNLLISAAVFDIVIGFAIAFGVYDFWLIPVLILVLGGAAMMEGRQPS